MSRFRMHVLRLLAFAAFLPAQGIGAELPLVWKFAVGQEHYFRMNQQMHMAMQLGPAGEMETAIHQKIDMSWKVDAVDDQGRATMTQRVRRVQMELQAPGETEMKYDTDSEEAPVAYAAMVAPMLKALVSAPIKLTMTPRGEITSVEIPEKLSQTLKGVPGAEMLGNRMTEKGFQAMMQQMALVLPLPADLVAGHHWTTSAEMQNPHLGKIATRMTFTYQGPRTLEGQVLEVFVPKLEMKFGDEQTAESSQLKVEAQKTRGEFLFNRTAGRLESSSLEQEMTLQITNGDREVEQKMKQKVEFVRIEK